MPPSGSFEAQGTLDRLQHAVQEAIPACSHLRDRAGDGTFRPHLSVAQLGAGRQAEAALAELLRTGVGPETVAALKPIAAGVLPRVSPRARWPAEASGDGHVGVAAAAPVPSAMGTGGPHPVKAGAALSSDALAASGLTFRVSCLYIIQRRGFAEPFRVIGRVALGSGPSSDDCDLPVGFVYSPPEPPEGSRCLRKGGNGHAILKARARGGAHDETQEARLGSAT